MLLILHAKIRISERKEKEMFVFLFISEREYIRPQVNIDTI